MFPFGIAAEKRVRGKEEPLKPKQPGACQLWHARRQLFLRQGVRRRFREICRDGCGTLSEGN
jgi:hypothetical protein